MRERGALNAKEGSIKKLQIPTLPPKSPRSGVTLHLSRQQRFSTIAFKKEETIHFNIRTASLEVFKQLG